MFNSSPCSTLSRPHVLCCFSIRVCELRFKRLPRGAASDGQDTVHTSFQFTISLHLHHLQQHHCQEQQQKQQQPNGVILKNLKCCHYHKQQQIPTPK